MSNTPASTPNQNEQKSVPPSKSFEAGGYQAWGAVGKKQQSQGNGKNNREDKKTVETLSLTEGPKHRFRLVGKPFLFYRHYDYILATSPGFEQDAAWQAGHKPRERYAVLCLDRNDNNKLKCLEAGPAVFKHFREFFEMTNKDPGGQATGPDWVVSVTIPKDKGKTGAAFANKRRTEYTVFRDEITPLTPEELEYIKANWVELKDMKTPTDPELIKEMVAYANSRSENDPVPGSKEWWAERRAKRDAARNGGNGNAPIASAEPEEGAATAARVEEQTAEGGAGAGYAQLFDQQGNDQGVKF